MLLALLVACSGGPPDALADCGDVDCRVTWSTARWETDRAAVLAGLPALEPVEQAIVVQALVEAFPGDSQEACAVLPEGDPGRRRCDSLNVRPHLWQIDREDPDAGPAGSGKLFRTLAITQGVLNPWADQEGVVAPCQDEQLRPTCQSEAGMTAAGLGRARDAGLACRAIDNAQWREECFFQVADAATRASQGNPVEQVELCMGAGDYIPRCLGHLATNLAQRAPSAATPDLEAWRALSRDIAMSTRALDRLAPEVAVGFADRAWSSAMGRAYGAVSLLTGAPAQAVPPEALPHLRAAIAWRAWQLEGAEVRSLADWVGRLEQLGADVTTSTTPGHPADELAPRGGYWDDDLEGEDALARISWFADIVRVQAEDASTDWTICLLEAAARDAQHAVPLFDEASQHPDPLVRWTAARLMPMVGVGRVTLARAAGDDHPLVAQRGLLAQRRAGGGP